MENHQAKLLQLLTDIEGIKTFLKIIAFDNRINEREAEELYRLLSEAENRALQ